MTDKKSALRLRLTAERDNLAPDYKAAYDSKICDRLLEIITSSNYSTIHTYLPFRSEINIRPLIKKLLQVKIRVVCPKTIADRKLEHLELRDLESLTDGKFGTQFPSGAKEYIGPYDMIIVPGLAFDNHKYRMGYGGGYYDQFLKMHGESHKVALAYPFQVLDVLPVEDHDEKVDEVLYFSAL